MTESHMKQCPYCAEEIRSEAVRCRYCRSRLASFEGGQWHRTVLPDNQPDNDIRIEVIQGGVNPAREGERDAPITLERTTVTGLSHRDGKDGYLVEGSSMAATCSLIAGRSPRRRDRAVTSVAPSGLHWPSA